MSNQVAPADVGLDKAALNALVAAVQADIDAGLNFGASLLVARRGQIGLRANLGVTSPGRPVADDDRFLLMSMSKAFTAVLVLRAIEAGRFRLDSRIGELLPGFGVKGKETTTVQQLLCHTGGLPSVPVPPPVPLSAVGDLNRKVEASKRLSAIYLPGTRCAYTSGTGYDVLGQILVETDPAGRNFNRIAQDELFGPLGMIHTSFGLAVDDARRVPASFTPSQTGAASPLMARLFNEWLGADAEYPSANAFATIEDVFRFTEALIGRPASGHQLLSPAMFDLARKNQTGDMPLEALPPKERFLMLRQILASAGLRQFVATARAARGGKALSEPAPVFPANFTLLGGYVRGEGQHLTPCGLTASPTALAAMGGASTGWMVDTERDLTFVFLSAGFVEGFDHPRRLSKFADLALAAVRD
jgi:CubicO group peptidase (beta-lactamase class C family)